MKKKAVAPGIYQWEDGSFSYRPWVRGRRTERKLKATTLRAALKEYKDSTEEQPEPTVGELCELYLKAGTPDKRGNPRPEKFIAAERKRVETFLPFFGEAKASDVRLKWCLDYKAWRCVRLHEHRRRFTGERSVDMELNTLSNVLNYAVLLEEIDVNRIRVGRPRFRTKKLIRHCRECCPRSGDELHRLADWLFHRCYSRSEAVAWQMLFEALSGCRTTEALQCRWDAAPGRPGFIRDGKWLYIERLKQRDGESVDCIEISPELQVLLDAMRRWRDERFPRSPWFFPSYQEKGRQPIRKDSLHHALYVAAKAVLGPDRPCTSHGMRAFFVTWQRVKGVSDSRIAEIIGHRSGGAPLIWSVYGRKVPPWASNDFNPQPKTIEPAWGPWLSGSGAVEHNRRKCPDKAQPSGIKLVEERVSTPIDAAA